MSKISFFVAQSCWAVVDSTKLVSAELSDFIWQHELAATIDSLDELRKCLKISFFVAQSCWTVVDSTKLVSAEMSDFGL
jgi:hypothetical protein